MIRVYDEIVKQYLPSFGHQSIHNKYHLLGLLKQASKSKSSPSPSQRIKQRTPLQLPVRNKRKLVPLVHNPYIPGVILHRRNIFGCKNAQRAVSLSEDIG